MTINILIILNIFFLVDFIPDTFREVMLGNVILINAAQTVGRSSIAGEPRLG